MSSSNSAAAYVRGTGVLRALKFAALLSAPCIAATGGTFDLG